MSGSEIYKKFMALRTRDGGLVMPNAGDGLSALILADAGFEAIATSSAAFAAALGRVDGRHAISRDEHLEHARLLGHVSGLPVNGDFEDGYGESAAEVSATVEAAVSAGLAGIGIEVAFYTHAVEAVEQAAMALVAGDLASATSGMGFGRITELLGGAKG
ncbi:MAG TPA: isocitrate lyase/phosphoenolpyruvate mutase family protein [Pseudonocardia sp.]|jgi:2-methylisocitrate lyase-like PEP mutase family enzyme|nr:isocitrate lyase/phosphoenolpyruvate mutase family protein [Pseudonocardia sp.]